MEKKRKRVRNKILILLCVIIIAMLAALAIVNYIVLPPKASENAVKYKYHGYDSMHLKSITEDENYWIFEFSSLNKYFNKNFNWKYIEKCQEKPISSAEKDPYIKCYCSGPADSYLRFYPKYYIVSTLTSNYIVFNKDSEIEPEAIAFCVFESIYGESRDIVINYNISEGFDNIGVYVHIEEWDKTYGRTEIGIEQKYNSQKKKWNPQEKYEYNWGFVSTDV